MRRPWSVVELHHPAGTFSARPLSGHETPVSLQAELDATVAFLPKQQTLPLGYRQHEPSYYGPGTPASAFPAATWHLGLVRTELVETLLEELRQQAEPAVLPLTTDHSSKMWDILTRWQQRSMELE